MSSALDIAEETPWLVWLSWLECCPVNQKVAGAIPGQGTCLGCGFGPQSLVGEHTGGTGSMFLSLPLLSLELKKKSKKDTDEERICEPEATFKEIM